MLFLYFFKSYICLVHSHNSQMIVTSQAFCLGATQPRFRRELSLAVSSRRMPMLGRSWRKPWENHGKTNGKPWENRKIMGKSWENHVKIHYQWRNPRWELGSPKFFFGAF